MVDQDGLRRFLEERRSGGDRRSGGERRQRDDGGVTPLPVGKERRQRRAKPDRRGVKDRRRPLAAQFTLEESALIREMVFHPERGVSCPRCHSALLLGPHEAHAGVRIQEVHCTGCRHSVAVVE